MPKKNIERLAQNLRKTIEDQNKLAEANRLIGKIQEAVKEDDFPVYEIIADINKVTRLSKEAGIELDEDYIRFANSIKDIGKAALEYKHQMHREIRIAVSAMFREEPAQLEPTLCTNCGKREAHFDDLCKRCANELGVRPTGKV